MYQCFDKISFVKPNSCRPGNSEKYLICKWKKSNDQTDIVSRYLYDVYDKLNELIDTNEDVMQLVPIDVLEADKTFLDYVQDKNDKILQNFLLTWQCIKRFSNVDFVDTRRNDFKARCFLLWNLNRNEGRADSLAVSRGQTYTPPWLRQNGRRAPAAGNVRQFDNWRSRKE